MSFVKLKINKYMLKSGVSIVKTTPKEIFLTEREISEKTDMFYLRT